MFSVSNSFGLAVSTRQFIDWPTDADAFDPAQPFLVVGAGSNLLFVEPEYQGQIISANNQIFNYRESDTHYMVSLGAGLNWHNTVKQLIQLNMFGLENLALIPGTVGAAPVQNIGAYGVEFSQFCHSVTGIDLLSGQYQTLSNKDCDFGYRDSIFKHQFKSHFLITQVELALPKHWQPNLSYGPLQKLKNPSAEQIFETVCQVRQTKLPDPEQLGNAGSFFKNPVVNAQQFEQLQQLDPDIPHYPQAGGHVKIAAGYLIDQAGLKGACYKNAQVHQNQALVLVNQGGATGEQVCYLAATVRQQVFERYQIRLSPEVRFIGKTGEIDAEALLESIKSTGRVK